MFSKLVTCSPGSEVKINQELSEFLGFAGFGYVEDDRKQPAMQQSLQLDFVKQYSVKNRYSQFRYIFGDQPIDDLGGTEDNSTTSNTASAISKFDTWFCSLTPVFLQHPAKQFLAGVVDKMLVMDSALPPFIRLCNLIEYDRGILLAHFLKSTTNSKKNGKDLQANSKGLLMTAFQRAFRHFDAKHGLHTLSNDKLEKTF